MTTQEILNTLILSESFNEIKKQYQQIGCDVSIISYSNVSLIGNDLNFYADLNWCDKKTGEQGVDNSTISLLVGFKTKSGYLSTKKLGLDVKNLENLSFEEVVLVMSFKTDAINKSFDPFFYENNIKSKNASAWNYIASNHLQDDCR
jgi:hypothetical protein